MEYTGYDNSCKLVLQASEHVSNVGCTHRKGENPYRTKLMHWRVKTDERNQVCTGESFNITFQFLRAQLAWSLTASFMGGCIDGEWHVCTPNSSLLPWPVKTGA